MGINYYLNKGKSFNNHLLWVAFQARAGLIEAFIMLSKG